MGALAVAATNIGAKAADNALVPFSYHASDGALSDLRRRLDGTRWPESATEAGWEQGPPLAKL